MKEVFIHTVLFLDKAKAATLIEKVDTPGRISHLFRNLFAGYGYFDVLNSYLIFLGGCGRLVNDHTIGIHIGNHILKGADTLLLSLFLALQFFFFLLLFVLLDLFFVK